MGIFRRKRFRLKIPKYHFEYYYPAKKHVDLEKMIAGVKILSQAQIDINTNLQSLSAVEFKDGQGSLGCYYIEDMAKAHLGVILNADMTLEELVLKINCLIQTKKYKIPLFTVETIRKKAAFDEMVEYVNVISDIIQEHGYVLIQALEVCMDFITIVSIEKKEQLDILEVK